MVDTGKHLPPWNLSFDGVLVCPPDVWGNQFPPPESWVDLHTTFPDWTLFNKTTLIAGSLAGEDGSFNITLPNHWRIIPDDTYYLVIKNNITGETYRENISQIKMAAMVNLGAASHVDLKEIQVPWKPALPPIARVNGRELVYPVDVARSLLQQFKAFNASTQTDLIQSYAGQSDPEPNLDSLLAAIEAEGNGPGRPDKCLKFLNEVVRSLHISLGRVRSSSDVVTLGLETCSNIRFNTGRIKDFSAFRLDNAVRNAFGISSPFFLGLRGRASFDQVIFAAGCVARGQKIRVMATDDGVQHVTSISV